MSKHDKAQDKTNAMRMFDAAGLPHEVFFYDAEAAVFGRGSCCGSGSRIPIRCSKRS